MTDTWDGLEPDGFDDPTITLLGTCQGKTIFGKRCRIRAVVRPDGTAFCAKHAIETVEGE